MGFCQTDCADFDLIDNPAGGCEIKTRKRGLYKIGFYKCTEPLPTPLDCTTLETLVDAKGVVFSSPLISTFDDPQTEELDIADCLPPLTEITGRQLSFEDRIAIDIPGDATAVPAVDPNPFADLKFWGNKNRIGISLRYMFLFCDGTIEIPRDQYGNPMSGSFNVFRSYEKQGSGNNSYVLEIKKGTILFKGDPLALREDYKPDVIIDPVTCATLAQKLGINI